MRYTYAVEVILVRYKWDDTCSEPKVHHEPMDTDILEEEEVLETECGPVALERFNEVMRRERARGYRAVR